MTDSNIVYERDEEYLKKYLNTIRKSDGNFKRVLISPLRYAGGKSKAIGLILNNLPKLREKKLCLRFLAEDHLNYARHNFWGFK